MIELRADGHFRYGLSEGALDEGAEGRWLRDGPALRLYTEPRPTAPALRLTSQSPTGPSPEDDAAFAIRVNGPSGGGIAGVDFRVEFDTGDPLTGYTQDYGWSTGSLDGRTPRWIQLHEPINGILSERLAIAPGTRTLSFVLEPNDLGIADFNGTIVTLATDTLTLYHRLGERHYRRAGQE
jgi:hypothetical protein